MNKQRTTEERTTNGVGINRECDSALFSLLSSSFLFFLLLSRPLDFNELRDLFLQPYHTYL